MKKIIGLAVAISAIMVGCTKEAENLVLDIETFDAICENETKLHLASGDTGYQVTYWTLPGTESIYVIKDGEQRSLYESVGGSTKLLTFKPADGQTAFKHTDNLKAIYGVVETNGDLYVQSEVNALKTTTDGTNSPIISYVPMVANFDTPEESTDKIFIFQNACALIRINDVPTDISKIVLTSDKKISGKINLTSTLTGSLAFDSSASNTFTVKRYPNGSNDWIFAVPAMEHDLKFEAYTSDTISYEFDPNSKSFTKSALYFFTFGENFVKKTTQQ